MFTVSQAGQTPCAFSIAPESTPFADEGGSGQVQVTTTPAAMDGCQQCRLGHDYGNVEKEAGRVRSAIRSAANNASASRSGTLTIAGRIFSVTRAGEDAGAIEL